MKTWYEIIRPLKRLMIQPKNYETLFFCINNVKKKHFFLILAFDL